MDSILIAIVICLLLANLIAVVLLFKRKQPELTDNSQIFKDEVSSLKNSFSQSFGSMSKEIAKDMTGALTKVDEKVGVFNQQVGELNRSQDNFSKILSGVKTYGTLAEFGLGSLLKDLLPASQFIANVKMKPEETSETVEFAIKLQDVMLPIDSHWPVEKYKAIDDAYNANDKDAQAEARKDLAAAFRLKAKSVNLKYIAPPKSTDFAIVYVPTEGLFAELSSYRDPKTKELLLHELRTKYKVTISGPNTLSALLQSYHLGFQTLKVQQQATQIYSDLRNISSRFDKHFDGIKDLRKKLEQAMTATDGFGRDARSIMNTLSNIKDPQQVKETLEGKFRKNKNSKVNLSCQILSSMISRPVHQINIGVKSFRLAQF
jgi:DNA recombination protein RmuC